MPNRRLKENPELKGKEKQFTQKNPRKHINIRSEEIWERGNNCFCLPVSECVGDGSGRKGGGQIRTFFVLRLGLHPTLAFQARYAPSPLHLPLRWLTLHFNKHSATLAIENCFQFKCERSREGSFESFGNLKSRDRVEHLWGSQSHRSTVAALALNVCWCIAQTFNDVHPARKGWTRKQRSS